MKIPKPQHRCGSWRVQITVKGQRYNRTFPTEEAALYWAASVKTHSSHADAVIRAGTVGDAIEEYILLKEAVLSPSTVAGYKKIQRNLMREIINIRVDSLSQEKVQRWVSGLVRSGRSPKTVANAHGLLSAALKEYVPEMVLRTRLPQREDADINIPTEAEVSAILAAAKQTKYYLPILLAIALGLRRSEIRGLTWDCYDGEYLQIKRAVVEDTYGRPVEKLTKTKSGKRRIHLSPTVIAAIEEQKRVDTHIVPMSGAMIYEGFQAVCDMAGVRHFRFHDLRHVNASMMLAAGIPNKYAQRRMGHATDNMLRTTYQHTIHEKELEFDRIIEDYVERLIDTDNFGENLVKTE